MIPQQSHRKLRLLVTLAALTGGSLLGGGGLLAASPEEELPPPPLNTPVNGQDSATVAPVPVQRTVKARVNARLREGPGTGFAVVGGVKEGESLTVAEADPSGQWLRLAQGGWIAAVLTDASPDAAVPSREEGEGGAVGTVTGEQVTVRVNSRLREGPGTDYPVVGRAAAGETLTVAGTDETGQWLRLRDGAWILGSLTGTGGAETGGATLGGRNGKTVPFADVARLALANNPTHETYQRRLEAAMEVERQGLANLLPQVNAYAGASAKRESWGDVGPFPSANSTDPHYLKLQANQVLFDLAAIIAYRQGDPVKKAATQDLEAVRQSVLLQTAQVTLSILQAEEVARLAQNNLTVTQRNLEATEARFNVGEITRTDVSRAMARMESARASLLSARNQVAVSRAQFQEIVGAPAPTRLARPDVPREMVRQGEEMAMNTPEIQNRPDVQAARHRLDEMELGVTRAFAGHLPTVNLQASASQTRGAEYQARPDPYEEWVVGVTLTQPLFAGGGTVSRTRQAQAQRDAQASELTRMRYLAQREAEQAVLDLRSVQATLEAYRAAERAAVEALRGIEQEYNVGTRTMLDLLDAQYQLFVAQTDRAKSEYSLHFSRFKVLQALGLLTPQVVGAE